MAGAEADITKPVVMVVAIFFILNQFFDITRQLVKLRK
jgi:hypothetical protein